MNDLTDKLADALAGLYEIHTKPDSGNGYISDGMKAGNAWRKAKEALEAYRAQRDGERKVPDGSDIRRLLVRIQCCHPQLFREALRGIVSWSHEITDEGFVELYSVMTERFIELKRAGRCTDDLPVFNVWEDRPLAKGEA